MKELLRIAVAQICQTIGYNATQTAPLELLQDVLDKFMREFTRDLRRQVEHCKLKGIDFRIFQLLVFYIFFRQSH